MNPDTVAHDLLAVAEAYAGRVKGRADHWEVYVASSRSLTVGLQGGVVSADDGVSEGVGVRVALGKRLGFASASGLSKESFTSALEDAIGAARALGFEDRNFEGFPSPRGKGREGDLDPSLATLPGEGVVDRVGKLYREAKAVDPQVSTVECQVSVGYGAHAVLNSSGVAAASRTSGMVGSAYVMAGPGDRKKTGSDFLISRREVDLEGVGGRAARGAVEMLRAKPLGQSTAMVTVWEPRTAASFIETCLSNSVNGRSVLEGRSAFKGRLGERLGAPDLTIVDDGQFPEGMGTSSVDSEGVAQASTAILDGGVLRSFLYDTYFGRLAGKGSTGNAARGGTEPFASVPHISTTTLVVGQGKGTHEDLLGEVDEGILVSDSLMGLGHANLISGDFSAVATNPYHVRRGEVVGPLEPVSLSGNLYKALGQVTAVGGDRTLIGGVATPTIVIDGLSATG